MEAMNKRELYTEKYKEKDFFMPIIFLPPSLYYGSKHACFFLYRTREEKRDKQVT